VHAVTHAQQAVEPDAFESDLLRYRSFFDYGGFEPGLETLLPEGYTAQWRLKTAVDGEYTDNVDKEEHGRDAFSTNGSLGLGWVRRSPRLVGNADYRFSSSLYESSAIDGRNTTKHAAAGAFKWQAGKDLTFDAGGHFTQNVEQGLDFQLRGVRSTYDNRMDEYGARASYSWRMSRTITNNSSYEFADRQFVSDNAEGEDTRSHRVGTVIGWQASAKDALTLDYSYVLDDETSTSTSRQNHKGTARRKRLLE
jgi:hypothetical protein